jgi:FkbM family methyltransferase
MTGHAGRRLRNVAAHLRQVGTDERLRSANVAHGRLDYAAADIHLRLSSRAEFHRLRSCAKEPFTVRWIEQRVQPGEVLYDIGANIGVYTLIAAVAVPGARVVSFEPGPANFAALCANLDLNSVADRVTAVPVALGDRPRTAALGDHALAPGASITVGGPDRKAPLTALVDRLDDLIERFDLPLPDHVKLDVDGAELEVLAGAGRVLASGRIKSALVELDPERGDRVVAKLERDGFALVERATGGDRPRGAPSYGLFARS